MSESVKGKRVLVTGGSKGIGLSTAEALRAEGAHVFLCARQKGPLDEALEQLRQQKGPGKVSGLAADVSDSVQVESLFQAIDTELGGLDILINNAGVGTFRATAELSVAEWDRVLGVNLSGAFYCSREAILRFKTSGGGWIINISSLAGKNAFAGAAAYNASKFGLNGFSEAMMLDHRADNVHVSYIMPGSVDTGFSGKPLQTKSEWKIAPEDVAAIVMDILHMPARTLISRVEVRPSRPKKD
jgi:NAD(P)-dependent dehydrogenase (short-subunit alcohol dehydrogenase family)